MINEPQTLAELSAACDAYEAAFVANDVDRLDHYFWRSDASVRFGLMASEFGFEAIRAGRRGRTSTYARQRLRVVINTFGADYGTYCAEDARADGSTGRVSQCWVRFPAGWRIVAAHVSILPGTPAAP
jgi:Protein of unknown function (DUF3225)